MRECEIHFYVPVLELFSRISFLCIHTAHSVCSVIYHVEHGRHVCRFYSINYAKRVYIHVNKSEQINFCVEFNDREEKHDIELDYLVVFTRLGTVKCVGWKRFAGTDLIACGTFIWFKDLILEFDCCRGGISSKRFVCACDRLRKNNVNRLPIMSTLARLIVTMGK